MSDWPKRLDGSNMSVGEMTQEQRRAAFKDAAQLALRYFARPEVKAGIAAVMESKTVEH